MTTRKRPASGQSFLHLMQSYLHLRDEAKSYTGKKDKDGKSIRKLVEEGGTVELDEAGEEVTGNIVLRLPKPIEFGGKSYAGMELRKSAQISFDDEAALALAVKKGINTALISHMVVVVDQDAFYVLQQQGKITEDELDSLLVEDDPKYSLWPLMEDS